MVGWEGKLPERGDDYANFTYPRAPVQSLWEEIRTLSKIDSAPDNARMPRDRGLWPAGIGH